MLPIQPAIYADVGNDDIVTPGCLLYWYNAPIKRG